MQPIFWFDFAWHATIRDREAWKYKEGNNQKLFRNNFGRSLKVGQVKFSIYNGSNYFGAAIVFRMNLSIIFR